MGCVFIVLKLFAFEVFTKGMWLLLYVTVFLASFRSLLSAGERSLPDESTTTRELQVKLLHGYAPYAGQVAVYHGGTWVAVCDNGWDEKDATVVCRELGYPGVTMVTKEMFFGVRGVIAIEQLGCYGNEAKLSECSVEMTTKMSECITSRRTSTPRYKEAGVICEAGNRTNPSDIPKVRLTGAFYTEGAGLVEVFINGRWGRVCDQDWSTIDAGVVCRELGYPGVERATCCGWYFGKGSGPPLMAYALCKGNETTLFHCPHVGRTKASCRRRNTAGVICQLNKPNVRLVGSPLPHAGFVQIRHYGRWGSFCDWGWGLTQGHVVCRELGFSRAIYSIVGRLFDKPSDWPILVEEAVCTGNESSIFECNLMYIRDKDESLDLCNHDHNAGVICESNKETGLNETAVVRLRGSNATYMGRVEIKQEGFWHAVCSIGWEKHDADVVCRQLGYPEAVLEVGHGQFGVGSGPMWLTSVRCKGNETSLDKCVSASWMLEPNCESLYGAGVVCKMKNITGDGEVRLRGSSEANAGRVEIKIGGVWGTVSDGWGWDIRSGHVVCRQLGYVKAVRVFTYSRYGDGNMNIWLSSLNCSGKEKNLLNCRRKNSEFNAASSFNAGVECTNFTNYTSDVEVRLFGMDTPNAGHVQVKYNDTWGTICATSLTYAAAEVICRQLGQGTPVKHYFRGSECTAENLGAEIVWLSNLGCRGFESSIDQCPHRGWGIMDPIDCRGCTPQHCSVCLICQPKDTTMKELNLRLVGSNLPYAGRVEVRYAGVWGVICPRSVNGEVYKIICRQLGYEDVMGDKSLYESDEYRDFQRYGNDAKGPFWLNGVYCYGNESNLSQCTIDSHSLGHGCTHGEVLELMCRPSNYKALYPIRLAGSSVPHAGRLEILLHGKWGTVCKRGLHFDKNTQMIACRQLGFGLAIRSSTSWLAPVYSNCPSNEHASGRVWLANVRCYGNESSLDQCPREEWSSQLHTFCKNHESDVCLVCYDPQYQHSEIAVELRGSEVPYAGRVKVRYLGVWGTLCGNDWKTETAEVLCRQLGYKGVELDFLVHNKDFYRAVSIYDVGIGPVWFNGNGCTGHEKTLADCKLRQEEHCSSDDIQLICKVDGISVNEFPVRLGKNKSTEGLVEVFFGGLWGTVGTDKWDLRDALVLCRQLGFGQVHRTYQREVSTKQIFWFGDFECRGSENTLGNCRHKLLARAVHGFKKPLNVFVHCGNDTAANSQTPSPAATFSSPRTRVRVLDTKTIVPTSAVTNFPYTSASTTEEPLCLNKKCQNGGSCQEKKCVCLERFAGVACEIYIGDDSVSLVFKMNLNEWNSTKFRSIVAYALTEYCRTHPCLQEKQSTNRRNQKKAIGFQPDDVIILQGYPKAWQSTKLLNVRLAVKIPKDSKNDVITGETLTQLLVNVAPVIQTQMGHIVAYVEDIEITSAPAGASGHESPKKPQTLIFHKSALIALVSAIGIVLLAAAIVVVRYRLRKSRGRSLLKEEDPDHEENIHLVDLKGQFGSNDQRN